MIGPADPSAQGGMATVINDILRSELAEKFAVRVFDSYGGGAKRIRSLWRALADFEKEKRSMDILHVHMASRGSFYRKMLFVLRKPKDAKLIIHLHSGAFAAFYRKQRPLAQSWIRKTLNRADRIVFVSEAMMREVKAAIPLAARTKVIHNGVEIVQPVARKAGGGPLRALYLGQVSQKRGIDDFLELAARFEGEDGIRFSIAGGNCDSLAENPKFQGLTNTEVLGWLDAEGKKRVLQETDLLINACRSEAFGIAMIEAMGYGAAVIGYGAGSVPEIVEDGRNGAVCPAGDVPAMEGAIRRLMADRDALSRMSENNRADYAKYSMRSFVDNMRRLYAEML